MGRYALVKRIGRGGMADVWVGKVYGASGFEKIVAVKLLTPNQVEKEEFQRAITDEARLQVSLKHPNIVDVYDLNFEAENPYLVMEYVEGIELRKLLQIFRQKKIKLPFSIAAFMILEISKALSHAHERRHPQTGEPLCIVHRDISPSNILISVHGDVKLSDFGIAKSSIQSGKTEVGQIKGKFRYMSPEQATGAPVDYRSDIFSLGLVFYEGLTGAPTYEGDTDMEVLERARKGDVHFPSKMDSEVRKILSKLLALKSQDRYNDLLSFRRELSELLAIRGETCDREALGHYLEGLELLELKEVTVARQEAEKWKPLPDSQVIDQTGRVSVIGTVVYQPYKKRFLIIGGAGSMVLIIVGVVSLGLFRRSDSVKVPQPHSAISAFSSSAERPSLGVLRVEADPGDATIFVRYGNVKYTRPLPANLSDLPLGQEVNIDISKKGFKTVIRKVILTPEKKEDSLKIQLQKISDIQVIFNAVPYATVSIPGQFSGLETPTPMQKIPHGEYEVSFLHATSGHQVIAHLKGNEGGSFVCFANMVPEDPSEAPSASCRLR